MQYGTVQIFNANFQYNAVQVQTSIHLYTASISTSDNASSASSHQNKSSATISGGTFCPKKGRSFSTTTLNRSYDVRCSYA